MLLVIVNAYSVTLRIASTERPWFFKYYNFFLNSLRHIVPIQPRIVSIVLPIGISFYTFHSLSYMIDTYRRRIVPARNFVDVALYILFFPRLVAGPIVRATDLLPQMREARSYASVDFRYWLSLFLIGYFKKAVISDGTSPVVDAFYANPANYSSFDALVATTFYAIQIYCDFSGYTDMAIAVAGMLGFQLRINFNPPILHPISASSGAAGTSACHHGCAIIFTFGLAGIAAAFRSRCAIS